MQFLRPVVQVRLYHDAKMAEVLSAQNIGSSEAKLPIPQYQDVSEKRKRNGQSIFGRVGAVLFNSKQPTACFSNLIHCQNENHTNFRLPFICR